MSGKNTRVAALVRGVARSTVHRDAVKGAAVYGAPQQLSFANLKEGNFGWGQLLHLELADALDVEAAFQAVYKKSQGLKIEGDSIQAIAAAVATNGLSSKWCWLMCAAGLYSRGKTARNSREESVIPDEGPEFTDDAVAAMASLWAARTRGIEFPGPEKALLWHLSGYTSVMIGNEALQGVSAADYTNVFTGLAYVVAPVVGVLSTKATKIKGPVQGDSHATVLAAGPRGMGQIELDLAAPMGIPAGGLYAAQGTGWRWDRFGKRSNLPIMPAAYALRAMRLPYGKPKKGEDGAQQSPETYIDIVADWKGCDPTVAAKYIKARLRDPTAADAANLDEATLQGILDQD